MLLTETLISEHNIGAQVLAKKRDFYRQDQLAKKRDFYRQDQLAKKRDFYRQDPLAKKSKCGRQTGAKGGRGPLPLPTVGPLPPCHNS